MPNALIKFSGSTTGAGADGQALIGIEGETVTVANVDDTNVDKWQFELLYVPPGSAISRGVKQAYSSTATWTFVPDSSECFVVRLRVKDANGNESVDDRAFGVLEADGSLIPPFLASSRSLNFSGQGDGWHPAFRAALKKLSRIQKQGDTIAISALDIDWSLGGTYSKTLPTGANAFTFSHVNDGELIVVEVTGVGGTTVTWPAGVKWSGGTAPVQTAPGIDVYTFVKIGANIHGSVLPNMGP